MIPPMPAQQAALGNLGLACMPWRVVRSQGNAGAPRVSLPPAGGGDSVALAALRLAARFPFAHFGLDALEEGWVGRLPVGAGPLRHVGDTTGEAFQ